MSKHTRRTISEIVAGLIAITAVATVMYLTRVPATTEIVPVVVQHGDTAWNLCLLAGHEGDVRDCAFTYEGEMIPGETVYLKVTRYQ